MGWSYSIYRVNEAAAFVLAVFSVAVAYMLNFLNPLYGRLLPTLAIAIAIVPHELAHRQTARSRGCWSRFVLYPPGFFVTLFVNAIVGALARSPVLFISGYTLISCYSHDRDDDGIISLAGPLTNIAIALMSYAVLLSPIYIGPVAAEFLEYLMRLNAFVAFFNLLPLGPLDGAKVFRWNIAAWAVVLAASIFLWLI
ncbi:MAG: peptidase M50 [Thermoproteus sp.]